MKKHKLTSDWHIHSRNSCDCKESGLSLNALLASAESRGVTHLGITDHLHTQLNFPDIAASRSEFDSVKTDLSFHFGIEVSCVSRWELDEIASDSGKYSTHTYGIRQGGPANAELAIALTSADIERHQIEFVVGGAHWPIYCDTETLTREIAIRNYQRQNMFLATHPLVDIVAHPWWWMGKWQGTDGVYRTDPWFDDFNVIPKSMHDEFSDAVIKNGKVVEINLAAMVMSNQYTEKFKKQYCEYLAGLQANSVTLSIGSDTHGVDELFELAPIERILEQAGIDCDKLWTFPQQEKRG